LNSADVFVQSEFLRIQSIPYDIANYNCRNKSSDFGNFLLDHGASDISKIIIYHESNKYTHEFLLWNGKVFDPTNINGYNVDKEEYLAALQKIGFKGMRITSPYLMKE